MQGGSSREKSPRDSLARFSRNIPNPSEAGRRKHRYGGLAGVSTRGISAARDSSRGKPIASVFIHVAVAHLRFLRLPPSGHSPEFHLIPRISSRAHFRDASCEISVARSAARLTRKRDSPRGTSSEKRATIFREGCEDAVGAPWRSGSAP